MSGFDTTYTGPHEELRNDRDFQRRRAEGDLEFAQSCARDPDVKLAERARAAIPAIQARIASYR